MATALATLVSRLESDVPARGGVPSASQYDHCARDAVADYGRRNSLRKLTTLAIVSGTASYTLPDDFLKVIVLESLTSPDGVIISGEGLIPVSATYRERYYIVGSTITFDPTPAYTVSRDLWYAAAYVLDATDVYADMTDEVAGAVMLKAQALALQLQANKAAQEAWQYAIGDEKVSKEKLAEALARQATEAERRYLATVQAQIGPVGMRADYDWLGH
jgi:hypothetical protein